MWRTVVLHCVDETYMYVHVLNQADTVLFN